MARLHHNPKADHELDVPTLQSVVIDRRIITRASQVLSAMTLDYDRPGPNHGDLRDRMDQRELRQIARRRGKP